MLLLIGLGLETKDISARALEALEGADIVMVEQYTTILPKDYLEYLEKKTGKKLLEAKRSDLEENAKLAIADAATKTVAILVPGDPLVATTHHIVLDAARRMNIGVRVYHSPSIFSSAIGESGLDIYRFGPTTTIPFWSDKYRPTSFLDVIKRNLDNNEHTLVLLDINPLEGRHMSLGEAVNLLLKAEKEKKYDIITGNTMLLAMGDVGRRGQRVIRFKVGNLGDRIFKALEGKAVCLIVPAMPNFAEEDAMGRASESFI